MSSIRVVVITAVLALGGCSTSSNTREYELHGQVLAVDPARQEITIKHSDIPGFMPGMTMPFKVRDRALLQGRVPGDLVRATLVLEETDAFLRAIEKTGSAPLTEPPPAPRGDIVGPGNTPPDVELIDESKLPRRLSAFRGQAVGVTFMYTRCPLPTFCPLMDRNFKTVQDRVLADPGLRGRVRLLSVTLDPEFDRPPVLATRARSLGAVPGTWTFLTGERASVEQFAGAFGVSIMRDDPAKQEIVHNLRTGVVRPDGTILTVISGNEWTPEQLVDDLRKAVAAK